MRNISHFQGSKVTIIGLARSGVACANLLYDLGADVSVTDSKPAASLQENIALLKSKDIKVEAGKHSREFISKRDLVVVSPGVPDQAAPVAWAKEYNIPVLSEIEVGWILCPAPVVAVTGANGKTTTTTLIGKVIQASGRKAHVCGNIGMPFTSLIQNVNSDDIVVLEVSSFQLEHIQSFKPKIAIITNINPNHLDRYKNMQEYVDAKKRIFLNQNPDDFLVLNSKDEFLKGISRSARSKTVFFESQEYNPNQSAVMAVADILGVSRKVCIEVFAGFKGLEHRMEEVAQINGIRFINDSKATTVESAIWALENIPTKAVLIAGGRDKGLDYRLLLDIARKRVKYSIVIGEAKHKIKEAFLGVIPVEEAVSLKDAVGLAFAKASCGEYVLLSPMCSSYDMFKDYEERGRVFKQLVLELQAKQNNP